MINLLKGATFIPLSQGKFTLVDYSDYEKVNQYKWYISKEVIRYYARRNIVRDGKKTTLKLHRFLLGESKLDVDHINGNGLDNRRINLRFATRAQNMANTLAHRDGKLGLKGVTYYGNRPNSKRIKHYVARIKVDGKTIRLGYFMTAEEAKEAYDKAALKYQGEFARIN